MRCRRARTSCLSSVYLATIALAPILGCGDDGSGDGLGGDSSSSAGDGTTGGSASVSSTNASADSSGGVTGMSASGAESSGGPSDTSGGGTDTDTGSPGFACIDEPFVNGASPVGDYSMFDVPVGSHCNGTNQQDITEIERVVFLGDSVTVGTPPTSADEFYRTILANALAEQFGLEPPSSQWDSVNPIAGTSSVMESGAFASCAVWGARNDDLAEQLSNCFAVEDFTQRTLVVFTMGGNDGAAIAKDYLDGTPLADVLAELDAMVLAHEEAVQWLLEPDKFPNGVFVVNANVYEFTDNTFDFLSCPTAGIAGFNSNPDMPEVLQSSLQHINTEYMRIAQENGTDVVFMSEGFCGHGFHATDAESPCYRGPGNETWFDLTCIHPTPAGHAALAEMFVNVIAE